MAYLQRAAQSAIGRRVRTVLLAFALLIGIYKLGSAVDPHYPIRDWLFWHYALCAMLAAVWAGCAFAGGHVLVRWVLGRVLPVREQIAFGFASGVFAFALLTFLAGLLRLYGPWFFFGLPTLMLAAGAWPTFRYLRRLLRHVRYARAHRSAPNPWWVWAVLAFGLVAVLMLYANTLVAGNVSYDARWYHMAMAEHYAAARAVTRFPEGWYMGAYPQLATYLYTWAFQLPWVRLVDRVWLCTHLEFAVFLFTLGAVPALVRRLVPNSRGRATWVAVFLFPGIFLYDSSLCGGADHIAALWAIPIYLALLRTWPALPVRFCLLLSLFLSACLTTKYTAANVCVFPILAVAVRALVLQTRALLQPVRRAPAWQPMVGPLAALAVGLVLTAPHWAKNWYWYGDPVYPMLSKYLSLHPWNAEAGYRFDAFRRLAYHPTMNAVGITGAARALGTYSVDGSVYHGSVPVFGSLFTLTVFCLPLLRRIPRIAGLYLAGHVGLLAWFWLQPEERYLQTLVPWMAAGVAAVLIRVWRLGILPRCAAGAAVALQVIWGGDVYFFPTHAMLGFTSPIRHLVDFIARGYQKNTAGRLEAFYSEVGKRLDPRRDVLLLHEIPLRLGVGVRGVYDCPTSQAGIVYHAQQSPRAVYDMLREFGVTHLAWGPDQSDEGIADHLIFMDFALRRGEPAEAVGGLTIARMPSSPPPSAPFGDVVAFYGCGARYRSGLYHLHDLKHPTIDPRPADQVPSPMQPAAPETRASQIERADFVVIEPSCAALLRGVEASPFVDLGARHSLHYYVRHTSP